MCASNLNCLHTSKYKKLYIYILNCNKKKSFSLICNLLNKIVSQFFLIFLVGIIIVNDSCGYLMFENCVAISKFYMSICDTLLNKVFMNVQY